MTYFVRPRSSLRTPIRSPALIIKPCTLNLQCWIPDNLAPGGDFRNDGEGATVSGMTYFVRPRSSLRTPIRSPALIIKPCTLNLQCWIPDNLAPGGDFRNDDEGAAVSGMTYFVRPRSSLRTPIRSPALNIKSCTLNLQCWIPDNPAPGGDFRNDGEGATMSGMP